MTFFSGNIMYLGILSIIIIAVVSYGLFYYIQKDNEKTIRESIFAQQLDQQDKSTESIAQRIGSDLRLITSMLQGLRIRHTYRTKPSLVTRLINYLMKNSNSSTPLPE